MIISIMLGKLVLISISFIQDNGKYFCMIFLLCVTLQYTKV